MLAPGTVVAGYRIDRLLGKGGMGVVYEATQLSLDRTVALKLLSPELTDDHAFRARFQREGRIQAGVEHPHIVTVHEAGETDYGLFLAMRLVRGPTLKDMILARELDAGRTLRILAPVADALDTAHAAGLIHRDVKPQNVLVGARDHAFLADFGLTKAAGDTNVTAAGEFVGTFDYISPEQIQGHEAGAASDVYAFGGVLYEALTGVVPYPGRSRAAVLYAHMAAPPPRLSDQRPELPNALDDVIARAMAKDPRARQRSASQVVADAHHALGRKISAAMSVPGPIGAPEEAGIRRAEAQVSTDAAAVRAAGEAPDRTTSSLGLPRTDRPRGRAAVLASAAILPIAIAAGALAGGSGSDKAASGRSATPTAAAYAKAGQAQYAAVTSRAISVLNTHRGAAVAALRRARTPAAQAQAADAAASAYSGAAKAIAAARPPRNASKADARALAALRAAAAAWTGLAAAARHGSGHAYASARGAVARSEAKAASAVSALARLGYGGSG